MLEFETKVIDVIQRTDNVKSFRLASAAEVDFKPGQFFFLTIKIAGQEKIKHFSFSNSPTEKGYLEFTKRITQSEFSYALDRLKIGDWAKLKLAYGKFTFTGEYDKIALLSAGIGITPIRSICKFASDKQLATDIVLVYGNNQEKDIIFKEDFDQMAQANKHLRVIYTLTVADVDKNKWSGRRGYIDEKMIKLEIPDYRQRIFYICGPPQMVSGLNQVLKDKLSIGQDKIRIENFTGY